MITMATALFNMQSSFANTEKINQRIPSLPNELKEIKGNGERVLYVAE